MTRLSMLMLCLFTLAGCAADELEPAQPAPAAVSALDSRWLDGAVERARSEAVKNPEAVQRARAALRARGLQR